MAIDFVRIRKENIREYGEGTRHLAFLGRLYPNRTHFIYELLQNAEDAKATKVRFSLSNDRLEFEHNGRVFNENDVKGICGVGEGTKSEDITQIGKFGIGFKSVYGITKTPEVHSGQDHFVIEHYVRPCICEAKHSSKGFTTLFVFPFDREEKKINPFDDLKESLEKLPNTTILFLKNIHTIYSSINGNSILSISKQVFPVRHDDVSEVVLQQSNTNKDRYLIFSRPITYQNLVFSVEIAYFLSKSGTVCKANNTELVVYFPTDKQTHLGFLIQGPYRTTPARDNIPSKDEFNRVLIKETAELMVSSLCWLRNNHLIDEHTYDLLPIDESLFFIGSQFRPFYDRLLSAFENEDLLITSSLSSSGAALFDKSNVLLIARGNELRDLIDDNKLRELTSNTKYHWVNGSITEITKPQFYRYSREKLDIREWRPEDLIKALDKSFLVKQNDEWMIKLYKLILSQSLWISNLKKQKNNPNWNAESKVPFLNKPIVRLQNDSHVIPFKSNTCAEPSAYLSDFGELSFPCVKKSLLDDPEVKTLFESLGYTEPSEVEHVIEHVLPKIREISRNDINVIDRIELTIKIVSAWNKASFEQKQIILGKLNDHDWLPAFRFSRTNEYVIVKHTMCYVPNDETQLFLGGSTNHFCLCPALMDMKDTLVEMGVRDRIVVEYKKANSDGHVILINQHGIHKRGLNRFDPDAKIDGIEFAIAKQNTETSQFIWNKLLSPYKFLLKGDVEHSSRQTYDDSYILPMQSKYLFMLQTQAWIPSQNGTFSYPCSVPFSELPEELVKDDELARMLFMEVPKEDPMATLAEQLGIPQALLELLSEFSSDSKSTAEITKFLERFKRRVANLDNSGDKPKFPKHAVADPERREEKAANSNNASSLKTYETKERSVRTSNTSLNKDAYLHRFYTNEDEEMVCQICKDRMPFKKRNGEYYFEAVEIFTRSVISIESQFLYLALCPVCAAKYKEYVKADAGNLQIVKDHMLNSDDPEIMISTDRQETITFNSPHYLDIISVMRSYDQGSEGENEAK